MRGHRATSGYQGLLGGLESSCIRAICQGGCMGSLHFSFQLIDAVLESFNLLLDGGFEISFCRGRRRSGFVCGWCWILGSPLI